MDWVERLDLFAPLGHRENSLDWKDNTTSTSRFPICPEDEKFFTYPSLCVVNIVLCVLCLVFSLVLSQKYNFVTVYDKKIRTNNISNTSWIFFFFTLFIRSALRATSLGISEEYSQVANILTYALYVVDSLVALFFAWSLNHQRQYRLSIPEKIDEGTAVEEGSDVDAHSFSLKLLTLLRSTGLFELVFLFLALFYSISVGLTIWKSQRLYHFIMIGVYIAQRVPAILLTVAIITYSANTEADGPSPLNKLILFVAVPSFFACDIPSEIWAYILRDTCFDFLSPVDFFVLFEWVAISLLFAFVVLEFKRNKEEGIWQTIKQIQNDLQRRQF
eukprot:TRINITY_DN454_c0_g2_i1.p1 TRINITY_DN454_c0_g2~~TRINITY_DN454_c0_g2_i1.p1  ORF type:complete len:331 (-),score=58.80 TRINITY_DN454_c0_g2_i1:71-1063(-)